MIKGSRWRLI
jgi:hypothetical protein